MMSLIILITLITLQGIVLFISSNFVKRILYYLFAVILIIIATFREPDPDYENYVSIFTFGSDRLEILVKYISNSIKYFTENYIYFFFFIACISIISKLIAIKQLTQHHYSSLLLFISHFYILYDLIQIRAAIASSFLLLAIKPLYEKRIILFFTFITIAIGFHYSASIFILLWFIDVKNIRHTILIIPVAYILNLSGFTLTRLIEFIPYAPIQTLFNVYKYDSVAGIGTSVNIFNLLHIIRCLLCILMIVNVNKLRLLNDYSVILIKIYTYGCAIFVLFSDTAVIAFRLSDLLIIVEIILIPLLVSIFIRKRILFKIIIISISIIYYIISIYYLKLLELTIN